MPKIYTTNGAVIDCDKETFTRVFSKPLNRTATVYLRNGVQVFVSNICFVTEDDDNPNVHMNSNSCNCKPASKKAGRPKKS